MHPERKNVLHIGRLKLEQKPFIERDLNLVPIKPDQIADAANSACGIVISEDAGHIGIIRGYLETQRDLAGDFGLSFLVILTSADELRVVADLFRELRVETSSSVNLIQDIGKAAEFVRQWEPGPPQGETKLLTSGFTISARKEFILKRAFGDCDRIFLEELAGGKDAKDVFCVHAWLKKSIVGPRPLPFFIKISEPEKIDKELKNYTNYADFYIPFCLRPNVVPTRCVRINGLASIVGNFVEDAITLRAALRSGQSPGIIFSLFENSLKGFRSQPDNAPNLSLEHLDEFIKNRARTHKLENEVLNIAQKDLKSHPAEIERCLCEVVKGVQRRFGPYHGDLHAGNVMVRSKDAILIDFSAVKRGPLTADPATLEVSLVFGTDEKDRPEKFDEWTKVVDELYDCVSMHQPPSLGTGPGPFSWLYKAVREIRHILLGCDCKQEEAAAVLVAYLLRFARLSADKFNDENLSALSLKKQAYALVVAERIVTSLQKGNPKGGVNADAH